MCTVTFVPRASGFLVAMNRDESRSRPIALPPRIRKIGGRHLLGPQEKSGGSWLQVNDTGMVCALLNWYGVPQKPASRPISRGEVLNQVAQTNSLAAANTCLSNLQLDGVRPFRLTVFDGVASAIVEFSWDQKKMQRSRHPWELTQWASSGHDEPAAQRARSTELKNKLNLAGAGTTRWLRSLHRSHLPDRGALSTCMHREDAVTVSYTELVVTRNRATTRHFNNSPCEINGPCDLERTDMTLNCLGWAKPGGAKNPRVQKQP